MNSITFQKDLLGVQNDLLRFAYKLTSDREEANDLLQETSLKALDNEDKYVPDCSLYRLIPYFGPVADFSVRQPVDQYLPLPFGLYRLHCPAADRRSAGCSAFSGFVDVRCDGLGDGGSGDQYDRYASGRYAAPAASAVCLR